MKKKINTEKAEKFFYATSKWIIFVPIVILVISLMLKLGQTAKTVGTYVGHNLPTMTPPPVKKSNFDLKGPYKCIYTNNEVKMEAYIKNNKVLAVITNKIGKQNIFFDGDCLFVDNIKKMCSLRPYTSFLTGVLANNASTIDNISSQYLKEKVDVGTLIESCKREDFEESVFK